MEQTRTPSKAFTFSQELDATRERVFKAWSERESLLKWWGPVGMKLAIKTFEFQPGGLFVYSMEAPNGSGMM